MSRLAKGLVALVVLVVTGVTVGVAPVSAGLLGPLGPSTAPPKQPPPPTTQPPTTAPPAPSTTAKPKTTAAPQPEPRLRRGPSSPPNSTAELIAALAPLLRQGRSMAEVAQIGFGQFPVGGMTDFRDTWMAPRPNPRPHWHKGTDIFAPAGTVVRATTAGRVEHKRGGAGGLAIFLKGIDGNEFYYAHLASFAAIPSNGIVKAGDVIGFVGTSGNAEGDSPHVHFEVHLRGRGPVNPKPILDAWLEDAINNAANVIAPYLVVTAPAPITLTGDAAAKAVLRPLTPEPLLDVLGLR